MSGNSSNINGEFERAKDQWNCALLQMTADLGRGAVNVLRVGNMMVMHSNRKEFYEHHQLVAYPGLDRLAFMLGLNEKTVRRARNKLVELGLIDVAHRYNNSNYYFLRLPVAAREHSEVCLDLLTSPRWRRKAAVNVPCGAPESDAQMSGGVDNYAPERDVNVQLPTEDSLTYPPSLREDAWEVCEDLGRKKEKESAEVERQGEPIFSDSPLSSALPPAAPPKSKLTIEELRSKLNMPDLGKSVRRMNFINNRRSDDE
jgi:hypothetical protein